MKDYKVSSLGGLKTVKDIIKKENSIFEFLKWDSVGMDRYIALLDPIETGFACKETLGELGTAFRPVSLGYGVTGWSNRRDQKILKVGVGRFNKKTGRYNNSFLPSFKTKVIPALQSLGYIAMVSIRYGKYKDATKKIIESFGLTVKPTISYMVFLKD